MKKKFPTKIIIILIVIVIILRLLSCESCGSSNSVPNVKDYNSIDYQSVSCEYDALQQLYLTINNGMSYTEVLSAVQQTKLPYTQQTYNGGKAVIRVAKIKNAALQKNAESGDNLEITFEYDKDSGYSSKDYINYNFGEIEYNPLAVPLSLRLYNYSQYDKKEAGTYIYNLGNDTGLHLSPEDQIKFYYAYKEVYEKAKQK